MPSVNVIDVIVSLCMVMGMAAGFRQGLLRQTIDVIALYVAVALAAQYSGPLTNLLSPSVDLDQTTLASLMMFGMFAVSWAVLHGLSYMIYPHTDFTQLGVFDRVGGAGLGLAVGATIVGVGLTLFVFILQAPWGMNYSSQQSLVSMVATSRLDRLIQAVLPSFYDTLRPWLPRGLPAMFGQAMSA